MGKAKKTKAHSPLDNIFVVSPVPRILNGVHRTLSAHGDAPMILLK